MDTSWGGRWGRLGRWHWDLRVGKLRQGGIKKGFLWKGSTLREVVNRPKRVIPRDLLFGVPSSGKGHSKRPSGVQYLDLDRYQEPFS